MSVKKIELLTARPPTSAPAKILVKPPTFYDPGLRVDRSGAKLDKFKYELQEKFTRNLIRRLSRHVCARASGSRDRAVATRKLLADQGEVRQS